MPWEAHKQRRECAGRIGRNSRRWLPSTGIALGACITVSGAALSGAALSGAALAQSSAQQIPGLIVSVPPSSGTEQGPARQEPATRPTIVTPTAAAPAVQAPKAPPKKTKPRRSAPRKSAARSRPAKPASTRRRHSVAVLVNDEPITRHEIDQRAKLMSVRSGPAVQKKANANFKAMIKRKSTNDRLRKIFENTVREHRSKGRDAVMAIFEKRKSAYARSLQRQAIASARASELPQHRNRALKELIEERLKLQEAKRLNALASASDVDSTIAGIAKRNKLSVKRFLAGIGSAGAGAATFKDRIRAQLSWNGVIRRKFGRLISVNLKEIDQHVASVAKSSDIVLNLHKITLPLPAKLDQVAMARKLHEAELLQSRFSGCNATRLLAKQIAGAKFQNLRAVNSKSIAEPTRSLIIQARDGEMVPPVRTRKGVVLYAVCGRSAQGTKDSARNKARSALQLREFDILARRHLADLKRDAHIEYR